MTSPPGRYSTPAADTDVRRTWRRWAAETGAALPDWLADQTVAHDGGEMPWFLKKQAV